MKKKRKNQLLSSDPAIDALLKHTLAVAQEKKWGSFVEFLPDLALAQAHPGLTYGLPYATYRDYLNLLPRVFPLAGIAAEISEVTLAKYLAWCGEMQVPDLYCYAGHFSNSCNVTQTFLPVTPAPLAILPRWISLSAPTRGVDPDVYGYRFGHFTDEELREVGTRLAQLCATHQFDDLYRPTGASVFWDYDSQLKLPLKIGTHASCHHALFKTVHEADAELKSEVERRARAALTRPKVSTTSTAGRVL